MLERFLKSLVVALISLALGAGCTRGNPGGSSRVTIQTPARDKLSALSLPAGRTACWGVNVTGSGIDGTAATSCSPAMGVIAGFQAAGGTISLSVPKGSARKIDLLAYLLPSGASACPALGKPLPPALLTNIYQMGTVTADLTKDEEEVQITAVFPGLANSISTALNMPLACTASSESPIATGTTFGFNTGSTYLEATAGDGSKLIGRSGGVTGQKVLSHASGMKLIVQ